MKAIFNRHVTKYRQCDDCKRKFILPEATRKAYEKMDIKIDCPECKSNYGHMITKEEFYKKWK